MLCCTVDLSPGIPLLPIHLSPLPPSLTVQHPTRVFTWKRRIWRPCDWVVTRTFAGKAEVIPTTMLDTPLADEDFHHCPSLSQSQVGDGGRTVKRRNRRFFFTFKSRPFVRQSERPLVCQFVHPMLCQFVRSFVRQSVHPFVRPSIRPFVYQSERP